MARAKKEAALTPEERLQAALVPDWEWPYKLPKNWCWTTVGTICDGFQYGYTEKATFEKIGPHFIRITDIGDGIINDSSAPYCKIDSDSFIKYKINKDDILIARMGSVGENGLATHNIDGVFASYLIRIVPRSNAKYVCNYLQTNLYWGQISEKAQGTTRLNVNANVLKNLIIPLPPLAEQQRIVDRIESLFAKLDEAKEKAQAVVDSFETRKAAILHKAFTGELTAKWREEHGARMESWRWIPLKKSGSWYGGGTPSMSRSEYWENGTLLWVTAKDMKSDLIEDTLMHTNMFGVENSSANYIAQPAVLFVMRSGILRRTFPVCMVKKPFTVNQDIKALVPTDNIDLEYLFWGCKANEKRILESCMKNGTTVESINSAALRDFEIPIAGSNEQIEIVRILDAFFAKEQQTKEAAEKVLDQIDLMKKSILARAFRGELGTNDPSEESAVELLRQVIEQEDGDVIRPKAKAKRIAIPAEIKPLLSGANEEAIVKLLLKAAPQSVSTQTVMSISKKKFELMDALRNLEKKQIVSKSDSGEYSLVR